MSKERYDQIVDNLYREYQIEDSKTFPNMSKELMTQYGFRLEKNEFFNKIKTDDKFAMEWGLKIEERELSFEELCSINQGLKEAYDSRMENIRLYQYEKAAEARDLERQILRTLPTKLITITYNNETIEIYE